MADLSWSKDAARRLPTGVGLSIAAALSLLLWVLIAALAQFL